MSESWSDNERKRYVEFINQTLNADESYTAIDPFDKDALFTQFAKGVIFNKLINACFPRTVDKSKYSNIQNKFHVLEAHTAAIEACVKLGCVVIGIGPHDLEQANAKYQMGLLWQIIKKALLKNVSASKMSHLQENENDDFSKLAPEELILKWISYHLKKAGSSRKATNFTSDISDSEVYGVLLNRLAPKAFTSEILKALLAEPDLLKRGETIVEMARSIMPDQTIFVTPEDIVKGQDRLNLAFAATLFNEYPSIGPSDSEYSILEEKIKEQETQLQEFQEGQKKDKEELAQLQEQLNKLKTELSESQTKTQQDQQEIEKLKEVNQQQTQKQTESEEQINKLNEELKNLKAELETKSQELQNKEQQIQTQEQELQSEKEKLKNQTEKLELTENQGLQQQEELTRQLNESKKQCEDQTNTINDLKKQLEEKEQRIQELTTQNQEARDLLKRSEESSKQTLQEKETEYKQTIESLKKEHNDELEKLKKDYEEQLQKMKTDYESQLKQQKESHDNKVQELLQAIQKLQALLPSANDREGWLTKQGGSSKTNWQKRWFVLKTNFMCYYKDNSPKSLKHPNGVVDLQGCAIKEVEPEFFKKKYCFQIQTTDRVYYIQAKDETEQKAWMKSIESAKAIKN